MGFGLLNKVVLAWVVASFCLAIPFPPEWFDSAGQGDHVNSGFMTTFASAQPPQRARAVPARSSSTRVASPRVITRVLNGRSEPARLQLIRQLANDPRGLLENIEEIVGASEMRLETAALIDPIPPTTFELLRLVARVEHPATERFLVGMLQHERSEIAMIATDVLGESRRFGAIESLKGQIERPEYPELYGFRFNLVRSLLRMSHPDAIEFLGTLEKQLDGQLRLELSQRLDEVSLEHFRGDAERFDAWQRQTARVPDSATIKLASESGSKEKLQLASSSYYGIPIHAKRLVFVIDCSGSMDDPAYGGTRLSHAKRELGRAIAALPNEAEFTILAFHELVFSWRTELVPATPENKAKAMRYVAGLTTAKATNTYSALREAMRVDSNLEAIFLISDGRPNRGEITAPAAIIQDITNRNQYQNLIIHTVGIAVSGPTQLFMEQLAETNAGMFRAVD